MLIDDIKQKTLEIVNEILTNGDTEKKADMAKNCLKAFDYEPTEIKVELDIVKMPIE